MTQQFAQLFFKMAEVRQAHVIEDRQDEALKGLDTSNDFSPPALDNVVASFWTSALKPKRGERWKVQVAADGSVSGQAEQVG